MFNATGGGFPKTKIRRLPLNHTATEKAAPHIVAGVM